jgi:hypothetical protein
MFFATKKIPAPGLADGQSNYKTMIAKILSPGERTQVRAS